jgi:hypothetical protein
VIFLVNKYGRLNVTPTVIFDFLNYKVNTILATQLRWSTMGHNPLYVKPTDTRMPPSYLPK